MLRAKCSSAAMASVALAAHLSAGQSAPSQEPIPILRVTTRLVQVEVVVRDKNGRPVPGLGQGAFEVLEDGRPQEIRFFTNYRRSASRVKDLSPGMSSNRLDITGPRRGVTVILIDSLNTAWEHRARALDNLRKFIDRANPDDRVAVYTLAGQLRIFQDFTGDVRSLKKKMDQFGGLPDERGWETLANALLPPEAAALLKWAQKTEDDAATVARAAATLDTLEKVANHLGSTPGWKSLVWISSGVPLLVGMENTALAPSTKTASNKGEFRIFDKEFQKAVRALTNSNIAVYPIDPRGLQELPASAGGGRALETKSMLAQLADRTGGRAYTDQNDILGALEDVTDAAQASYSVAYYPANSSFDGKYRKIEVRVKKPDLSVSHRKGYFALDSTEVRREDPDEAIRAAALDPLDAAVIGIDAGLQLSDGGVQLIARIDAGELLWGENNAYDLRTSIGVFQYDDEGRQLASFVDRIDFTCDGAKAESLSRYGLSFTRKLTLSPSADRLRVVVRSARTGAIGSLTVLVPR
jgi:VWFA-related protein